MCNTNMKIKLIGTRKKVEIDDMDIYTIICILFIIRVHKICEMRKYLEKQAKREFYFVHLPITDTNAELQHGY